MKTPANNDDPKVLIGDHLSIGTLFRVFRGKIVATWGLTLLETTIFALFPLLIGRAIDGLLTGDTTAFQQFIVAMTVLLVVATGRRIYDTRAYGSMRIELGRAQAERAGGEQVSVTNARVLMGRELVDFLETQAPMSITGLIQIIVSITVLFTFHGLLALSASVAAISMVVIYGLFARRFFTLNSDLNHQAEAQVSALEARDLIKITAHLTGLRRHEVRLSDTESVVYGLIFTALLSMLAFNLWFAATQIAATPGQIFSIVSYSYEFVQSAVLLPMALLSLTRLSEITERINKTAPAS